MLLFWDEAFAAPAGGGHGNTLRGLVMHLDGMRAKAMEKVEIPSGIPLVCRFSPDLTVLGRAWLEESPGMTMPAATRP